MPRRAWRTFTPQFKAEVVLALLTGEQSAAQLIQRESSPTGFILTLGRHSLIVSGRQEQAGEQHVSCA